MIRGQEIDDGMVIGRVLAGDRNSYELLMQKYNTRLYRVCRSYLKNEAEIEDLMQDTYIKGFLHLRQFGHRASFATWITRILINEVMQRFRKENRIGAAYSETIEKDRSDNNTPELASMNKELGFILEKSIDSLPENYKVVFMMREVEKLSVAETGSLLGITESNVKVRLNRAKEMLRDALVKEYPLEELFEFERTRCARVASNVLMRLSLETFTGLTLTRESSEN